MIPYSRLFLYGVNFHISRIVEHRTKIKLRYMFTSLPELYKYLKYIIEQFI